MLTLTCFFKYYGQEIIVSGQSFSMWAEICKKTDILYSTGNQGSR